MRLHFISGLPRSGSTLLAAILRQNPALHAEMTSPVHALLQAMRAAVSARAEAAHAIMAEQKRRLLMSVFAGFYGSTDKVVFDTSRAWCATLPLAMSLFPEARVITLVRDLSWIMDSFEQALARYPLELSGIWGFDPGMTVYQRVNGLAAANGMVGWALDALREACAGSWRESLILVEYDALVRAPEQIIGELYERLGLPWFRHDFDDLAYAAPGFDARLGMPDLHTVRAKIEWRERRTILPPDLFARFAGDAFWRSAPGLTILDGRDR